MAKVESRPLKRFIAFILASWLIFFFIGYCANVWFNSNFHKECRRLWDEEENYRAMTGQAWTVEVRKHYELQLRMEEECMAFVEMRREWTREWEEERIEREKRKR
jgi:hypothetical protein